ncbi:hypothetical protein MSPP1_002428 [Malassezia sp. CBS 17886]|nr:hypothetical protein MSPP1_002428 [Malassezia sp. CBS 17886]
MAAAGAKAAPLTCPGHTRPVVHLEYSEKPEDGTFLMLSSCKDGNPMLRDWLGDWVGTFLGHKGAVWSAKLSGGDAARAATGSADFSAKVWDTYTGDCLQTYMHNHIVRSVAIDEPGERLVTGGHEKNLRLFDLGKLGGDGGVADATTFQARAGRSTSHDAPIRSVVLGRHSPQTLVTATDEKELQWWDMRTLTPTHTLSFDVPIASMDRCAGAFGELVSVTAGHDAFFIDLATREIVRKHTLDISPSSVSLDPVHGNKFAAGCIGDEWVRVYDYESAHEVDVHKGHHGPVHCVSYSPDSEIIASGSEDGTIRLWQTNPSKKYGLWS